MEYFVKILSLILCLDSLCKQQKRKSFINFAEINIEIGTTIIKYFTSHAFWLLSLVK